MTEFKVGDKVRLKAEFNELPGYGPYRGRDLTVAQIGDFDTTRITTDSAESGWIYTDRLEHVPPAVTIDPARTYKTRDGREVRIYATDGGSDFPVHGAFRHDGAWFPDRWTESGAAYTGDGQSDLDLIEVKPERTRWVIVGEHLGYATQEKAQETVTDFYVGCSVAVVPVTFREGDGLEGGK